MAGQLLKFITILCSLYYLSSLTSAQEITLNSTNQLVDASLAKTPLSDAERWIAFKSSPYYLPPFENAMIVIPENQRKLHVINMEEDIQLLNEMAKTAVEKKDEMFHETTLLLRYSKTLIDNILRHRRMDLAVRPRYHFKPEFYYVIADLLDKVIKKSDKLHSNYKKKEINTDLLLYRTKSILENFSETIKASSLGIYLKWDQFALFDGPPGVNNRNVNLVDEGSHIVAQWRALGYGNWMSVMKQVVNLIRMFAKSPDPSLEDPQRA